MFTNPQSSSLANQISTDMYYIWIILSIFYLLIYVVSSSPSWYLIHAEGNSKLEGVANNDYSLQREKEGVANNDYSHQVEKDGLANNDYSYQGKNVVVSNNDYSYQGKKEGAANNDYSFQGKKEGVANNDYSYHGKNEGVSNNDYSFQVINEGVANNDYIYQGKKERVANNDYSHQGKKEGVANNDYSHQGEKEGVANNDYSSQGKKEGMASNDYSSQGKTHLGIKNEYSNQEKPMPKYICEYDCTNWPYKSCKQTGYENSKWGKINKGSSICIAKYTSRGTSISNYPKCAKLPMGCKMNCDENCNDKTIEKRTTSSGPNNTCSYNCDGWPFKQCTNILHKLENRVETLHISSPYIDNKQRVHTLEAGKTDRVKRSYCIPRLYRKNGEIYQYRSYPLCGTNMDPCQSCWSYCEENSK